MRCCKSIFLNVPLSVIFTVSEYMFYDCMSCSLFLVLQSENINYDSPPLPSRLLHPHKHTFTHTQHTLVLLLSPSLPVTLRSFGFILLYTRTSCSWSQKLFKTFFTGFDPNICKFLITTDCLHYRTLKHGALDFVNANTN